MSNTCREAFDLHNPACRSNFKGALKRNKWKLYWWVLVIKDTLGNVCPVRRRGKAAGVADD